MVNENWNLIKIKKEKCAKPPEPNVGRRRFLPQCHRRQHYYGAPVAIRRRLCGRHWVKINFCDWRSCVYAAFTNTHTTKRVTNTSRAGGEWWSVLCGAVEVYRRRLHVDIVLYFLRHYYIIARDSVALVTASSL